MNDKLRSYYWISLGVKAYFLMKMGQFASAAKLMRYGLSIGAFEPDNEEGSSWRTSILLNYEWSELGS